MLRREAIRSFLEQAADRLEGDWILLGGAVVALLLDPDRGTEDIDLVPMAPAPDSRLRLMEAAVRAGLGVETVNSAADFFLRRLPGWESDLVELLRAGGLVIHRPGPRLFVRLKAARMNERDLEDCKLAVRAEGAGLDWTAPLRELRECEATSESAEASARQRELIGLLESLADR